MASTTDVVQGWIKSGGSASSPEQAVDALSGKEQISQASPESDEVVRAENSTQDELVSDGEDTQKDSTEPTEAEAKAAAEATPGTSTKEVITVTDATGKRRKVEVDWNNKEQIKKDLALSYGARKWQAERDQAITGRKEIETKYQELNSNWQKLEQAYGSGGIEGLVDLLEGRKGAYQETLQKTYERRKFLESASPEEVQALQQREAAEQAQRELARIRKENEDFRKKMSEKEEAADLAAMESRVHPVFNKYRFADKLGNEAQEHMLDEMLWNSALKRLEPYETQGLPITAELIEKEFAAVASSVRGLIGKQAEKKVARVVEQKKQEATENVQAKVMSGYKSGGVAREASDLLNQGAGGINQLLKNWGKFGSSFGANKK